MKKYLSIFLLIAVALSSVGMSVSQHFCTMSKEEIEKSLCDMCSSKDHGGDTAAKTDEKSCCSNEAVHLRLETDATNVKVPQAPQPLFSEPLFAVLLESNESIEIHPQGSKTDPALQTFPLAEEHTVLRV